MQNIEAFLKEVNYAYNNVTFYKDKLDNLGIDQAALKAESYAHVLPFTEKKDYRRNFPKGVLAKGFSLNHPMLNKSQSSGTTGDRLVTFEVGMNLLRRALSCAEANPIIADVFAKPGRKICRYAAPNCSDVECANPHSTMEDRLLADGTLVLPVYHDLLTTSEELIERAISEIYEYKPDLFYVDPTHFAFLLREFKKRGLKPPKVPVIASYSAVTQVSRRQICEFFPAEYFVELLSSSEMGWIAMECPQGHLHLNENGFFFEMINQQGEAASKGELAELCISSIDQGALPHIRYQTGDMVTYVDDTCSCGHSGRQIFMEGRSSQFIKHNNEASISPLTVDRAIGAPEWLDLYKFEQIGSANFTLKMMVNERFSESDKEVLITRIKKAFDDDISIEASVVSYIASDRSGKFQSVKGSK
ncbi:phenylacetate--CoA ligase family protein [Pleionea sp. CnH1-48]|uniref:phenylacetate--CoA ligase family protein n=1 Tax=Pleionea sp. CnH1-48 TaxID=2954494 RepID=UPI002097FDC8|nr:hypothetical protein [Pleionea sp. CnH1-48]MCO7226517.1 hypothetical protein [Pleionea sp. CnH1-48]